MQRYDRERELRSFRGRDNESRMYDPRGNYRNEERWQSQAQPQWRDEEGPSASYADQGDWRESYTGYDDGEGYRSDFAQQRYGRGQNVGFGRDYDERSHGPRGSYGAGRDYGSGSGQYGSSPYEGGRPLYGENSRGGWSNDSIRQGYSSPRSSYQGGQRQGQRNYGYGPSQDYGRDLGPSYARNEPAYGRQTGGAWRDYDDSGQGYVGGYGSDLGYGGQRERNTSYGQTGYGQRDDSLYGGGNRFAQGGAYAGDRYAQGANYGTGRESSYGRGYDELQNQRGRGPKNYMRSDERIKEDLSERLSDDPMIDAGDINVDVKNGVVTLSGSVDARHLKHRVEDIADNCGGVKDVENKLTIRKAGTGQNLSGSPGGGSTSAGSRSDESGKKH
ncbi:MAG TPA: BON domain-containing protein [Tahibacter sp.]|uniref:BON domain-containing protein n=1 Tax=Tahibacter sp. TaxID=2056211 RepID=UPI002D0D7D90|nr:BON domain-containing protein [Tahibacter sp.]HSX62694.1 BON domain-containing protein [Tahibacter sp.]